METKKFDVFVIGTGTAGQKVAYACANAGMKVAIADDREFGGTCANRGCDPKKVLVGFAEVVHHAHNLKKHGISEVPHIDWKAVQQFKKKFTAEVPAATEKDLEKAGITMYHQSPKFVNQNTLSVEGKTVNANKIVIATGLRPRSLFIPGREYAKISDDFLSLPELPESILFLGAGYVGMEFAHIAARCGVEVTVIEQSDRILNPFDADMAACLLEASKSLGINFVFNAEVTKMEALRKNYRVHFNQSGKQKSLKARMVFNTTGRVPSIDDLHLEKGNVEYSENGISVNEHLQSVSNASVYACGDVSASGALPLTPLSSYEADVVSENIRKGYTVKLSVPPIPSAVFTLPQLASIGLTETEAKEAGHEVEVHTDSVPSWYSAKRIAEDSYAYKIIVDKKKGTFLGAHLLSVEAAETINLFSMAMKHGISAEELKETIFTYPTWGSDIQNMF